MKKRSSRTRKASRSCAGRAARAGSIVSASAASSAAATGGRSTWRLSMGAESTRSPSRGRPRPPCRGPGPTSEIDELPPPPGRRRRCPTAARSAARRSSTIAASSETVGASSWPLKPPIVTTGSPVAMMMLAVVCEPSRRPGTSRSPGASAGRRSSRVGRRRPAAAAPPPPRAAHARSRRRAGGDVVAVERPARGGDAVGAPARRRARTPSPPRRRPASRRIAQPQRGRAEHRDDRRDGDRDRAARARSPACGRAARTASSAEPAITSAERRDAGPRPPRPADQRHQPAAAQRGHRGRQRAHVVRVEDALLEGEDEHVGERPRCRTGRSRRGPSAARCAVSHRPASSPARGERQQPRDLAADLLVEQAPQARRRRRSCRPCRRRPRRRSGGRSRCSRGSGPRRRRPSLPPMNGRRPGHSVTATGQAALAATIAAPATSSCRTRVRAARRAGEQVRARPAPGRSSSPAASSS